MHRSIGALFTFVTQAVFTGYGEITFTALRYPAFSKFRELQFFPAWTWTLSMFIIKIPLAILETFTFLAVSYYVIGFSPSVARFFRLWLLLAIADMMASSLFRMIAGFCKTMVLASSIGGFFIMALFTLGGYVIPRTDIRGWWIWAYWGLPLSYVQNGAAVNEYLSHQWRKPLANDNHTLGHRFILSLGLFDRGYWYWLACGVLVLYAIGFNFLFAWAITYLRPVDKTRAVVSKQLLAEWHKNRTGEAKLPAPTKASSMPRSLSTSVKSGCSDRVLKNLSLEGSVSRLDFSQDLCLQFCQACKPTLLLLKRGGQTIYAGPLGRHSHKLIEYFQSIAAVPGIKGGENPAAWMLEITTPGMEQKLRVDFAELYRNSPAFERTNELVDQLSISPPNAEDISFPTKFAQPMWTQFVCCLWKQYWTYWRSPGYNVMRFALSLAAALFMGTVFWGLGKKIQTQRRLFSLMGSIYTSHSFYGVLTARAVQPLISSERTVFYRERSAGMYSETPYALAQCLIEIPYVLMSSSAFELIEYAMIKLKWEAGKFFWYLFFTFTSQVTFVYWGMLTVSLTPNAAVGAVLAGLMYQLWSLFNGFAIPHPQFPIWWKWIYWCNPSAYTLYGSIASQFGDLDDVYLTSQTGMLFTVKELIKRSYGFKHTFLDNFLWFVGGMAAVFPLLFAVGFIVCI